MSEPQMFLAKALYDNIAETPDELAFRRGDVLTVVEQNTGGLDGWWLCSLRGKQGIAPGNRLKILSGMLDTSREGEDVYDSPKQDLNRRSWDVTPNKVAMPQKKGDVYLYESSNRSFQDYDVPPSRYIPKETKQTPPNVEKERSLENYDTPVKRMSADSIDSEHNQSFYDTLPSSRPVVQTPECAYDVPPSQSRNSLEAYDIPSSNRSSVISDTSNDSSVTISSSASNQSYQRSSNPPSMCDSARSSLDVSPHDFYDVPTRDVKTLKQLSTDSGLDLYDTPPRPKPTSPASYIEDYDVPKTKVLDFDDSKVPEKPYEVLHNKSVEHALDDIYDVPKNNAPKVHMNHSAGNISFSSAKNDPMSVYDIPPQVTRDSVLSAKSDSSEEGQRLSTCSIDSRGSASDIPTYDELPLDLDAALDLLVKLQQDVQKASNKLLGFVSSTWRKKESLQTKLYDIKVACTGVKTSLSEFVDFAQGTLANSTKLSDKKLVNKLYKQLNPLQNSLQLISSALKNLEEMKWQVTMLSEPLDSSKSDDLGQIATLSKDLTSNVRKLASFIQGNSTLLFQRSHDMISVRNTEARSSFDDSAVSTKPPIGPKPELGPKHGNRSKTFQQRPLPPPPPVDRPLPPTPVEQKKLNTELPSAQKAGSSHYINEDVSNENEIYQNDDGDWTREYDYVHLESRDIAAQVKRIEELAKKQADQEVDTYESKLEADLEEIENVVTEEVSNDMKSDFTDGTGTDVDSLSEQELKTPVNVNTDNGDFVLPDVTDSVKFGSYHLDPNDKQVLVFYSGQMETHSTLLTNAIDAFFNCVESNEPPKVFISHSKFVIVSAHKLVYIGDALHRSLMHSSVKTKIMHCANLLCDKLKLSVTATKTAAIQYPSVPAVQDMVDRVVDVSHAAHDLKLVISQASSL